MTGGFPLSPWGRGFASRPQLALSLQSAPSLAFPAGLRRPRPPPRCPRQHPRQRRPPSSRSRHLSRRPPRPLSSPLQSLPRSQQQSRSWPKRKKTKQNNRYVVSRNNDPTHPPPKKKKKPTPRLFLRGAH